MTMVSTQLADAILSLQESYTLYLPNASRFFLNSSTFLFRLSFALDISLSN